VTDRISPALRRFDDWSLAAFNPRLSPDRC